MTRVGETSRIDVEDIEAFKKGWEKDLEEEDGFQLMENLVRAPWLVSIRGGELKSRNVLHMAVRREWYGLVLQIMQIFSPSGSTRHHDLQPQILRDLLTEKEVDERLDDTFWNVEIYSSRLDVFGMILIQRHKAISTLIARTISSCNLFDAGHPYEKVVRGFSVREYVNTNSQEREVLNRIYGTYFPKLITWLGHEQAPNMGGGLSSVGDLENLDPLIKSWMLINPFLPLAEHLVFEYSRIPHRWKDWIGEENICKLWDELFEALEVNSFLQYFLTINNSRRTLLHVAFLRSNRLTDEGYGILRNRLHGLLFPTGRTKHLRSSVPVASTSLSSESPSGFFATLQRCFMRNDSSGRTPLEVYLASATCDSDGEVFNVDVEMLEIFKLFNHFDKVIESSTIDYESAWDLEYGDWRCFIPVDLVHKVNGYYYQGYVTRPHSVADVVVACSQHDCFNRAKIMSCLLDFPDFLPQGLTHRKILSTCDPSATETSLTPLKHAVLVGDIAMVRLLVQDNRACDPARFKNQGPESDLNLETSVLHLAATQGNPEIIRIFLDSGAFDPCYRDSSSGDTALHAAASSPCPRLVPVGLADFVEIPGDGYWREVGNFRGPESLQTIELPLPKEQLMVEEATYQGCLNMLLQAGIDIWERNNRNEVPFLHKKASPEYRLWWFEKLDKETQKQTAKLTTAANALSVTAALVATASYIGPLQPPLGYGSDGNDPVDKVQADFLSVRVFIICNTLSFYIALVAIMFSLTPSLPMPQESMLDELKRIRRSVTLGLVSLIMAIVTILIAFASASIAVLPQSWNRKGLSTGTLVVGGFMCSVVLALCWVRAVRLMFHKSRMVRNFYRRWVYI